MSKSHKTEVKERMKAFLDKKYVEFVRRRGGLTYASDFARWLEVDNTSLSQWMSASRLPAGKNVHLLAAKLGPEVYDILEIPRQMPDDPRHDMLSTLFYKLSVKEQDEVISLAEKLAEDLYQKAVSDYVIDEQKLDHGESNLVVMHPLPRVGEIAREVDDLPNAAYFRQMRYGLEIRTALMAEIMGK